MKKPVLLILVLGNLFLFCSAAVADGNDRWRQLMDAEITGASTGFQRWHIIQPMTLVAKPAVGDVEYAALASLLQLQLERGLPPVEGCLRNLPIGATGVIAERKRVEDYRVMVTKREKNWLELRMRLAGKSDVSSGTVLVGYLAKLSSSPREAAKKYLEEQLYQYKAVSFPMNEEWSKLLLDGGGEEGAVVLAAGFACRDEDGLGHYSGCADDHHSGFDTRGIADSGRIPALGFRPLFALVCWLCC